MEKEERTAHESFGQISFSRVNCNPSQKFYGSELPQDHYITMEVNNSEIIRELSRDRYYNVGIPIMKIRMSSGQFSELITSMNIGSGVCCTIERVDGKKVADLPIQESRKEFVHRKFEERMKIFADKLKSKQQEAKEIVKKKTLSKDDIHNLTTHLEWLTQEISGNIPFFAECFQDTMDEVVHEAKLEVENAIQHKINVLGLQSLHEQGKLLDNK
ncbi:MAG: hypothetical protein WC026_13250 [Hyphomicrobium sp.]|uniref:hypothetical protein n=1 Tax=Hyphomicrobium sp. TaxID=82 RepID=UPI003569595B